MILDVTTALVVGFAAIAIWLLAEAESRGWITIEPREPWF